MALLVVFSFNSCKDSDNVIDDVFQFETGAVLRTLSVNNAVLNSSEPTSEFSVTVEEQDEQDGALLESVDIYVSIRDLSPENGTTVADDAYVGTIDGSSFTDGPHGLPRATITTTFGATATAMGLGPDDYAPGDIFEVELRLNLTDGRTFGASSVTGIISGGFFSSPFKYNALITCTPEPGDYTVDMQDSYGDGWQGDGIAVNIDDTTVYVTLPDYWTTGEGPYSAGSEVVNIPDGTSSLTWDYTGDSYPEEVTFQIYGPNAALLGDFGPEPAPGLLPVTLCLQD